MSCNCKRSIELQEKYGEKEEETFAERMYRYTWKVILAFLALGLSIVTVPIIVVIIMYNIVFGGGKPIVIPQRLIKYFK